MTDPLLLLRDLIHERTGLFFPDGPLMASLEARLSTLFEKSGCGSLSDYHRFLDKRADFPEWHDLITELSRPVSSFLRHTTRARLLADALLPEFFANAKNRALKIWSAGCATGEEPLSIAMALSDAGWFERAGIEINATDANLSALETARAGIYREPQVRYIPTRLRDEYFEPMGDAWRVKRELHARVRWSPANLVNESEIAELAASEIIFCRNVFIYFSDDAICRTLRLFGKYMPTGGVLFTDGGDHFASLVISAGIFEEQVIDGISIRRKPG